jgi:lysophospholipase L1-like esterase
LREFAQNTKNVVLFDLFEKISWRNSSTEERGELWDDNLHFKPKGYDIMGESIYLALLDLFQNNQI